MLSSRTLIAGPAGAVPGAHSHIFRPQISELANKRALLKCTTRAHLRLVRCNHPHLSHNVYNGKHLFSQLRTAGPENTRLLLGAVDAIGSPRVLVCVGLGAAVTDEAIVQMMFSCRRTICGETSSLTLRVMPAGPELGLVIV